MEHFHPAGLRCLHCHATWAEAREFRTTRRSQLTVYRCHACRGIYNLYSRTIFEARQLRPAQVVLLVRGVLKGESAAILARELEMSESWLLFLYTAAYGVFMGSVFDGTVWVNLFGRQHQGSIRGFVATAGVMARR